MNILVFTREFPPYVVGGMSYHLANLYSELVELGHDVSVVTGVATDSTRTASELVAPEITVHPVEYGRFTAQHLKFPFHLRRFLRTFDLSSYDVAVTHTPIPFGLPIPVVGKYHDCPQVERQYFRSELSLVGRLGDSVLNPTRRVVDRRSLSAVDHAIFNSRLCQQAWETHYDISIPSTVVYNGVDPEIFTPRETAPTEEYILFVGDSERKGLSRVRRFSQESTIPVYIVGDVDSDAARTFDRLSPDRLAELYTGAVATVHPAKFEAFGNVVLESLACGTPVVTTSQCGASEILDDSCSAVDTGIDAGIDHCRELDPADCVATAREYTWRRVAERTQRLLS